jgi:hypothetical protein
MDFLQREITSVGPVVFHEHYEPEYEQSKINSSPLSFQASTTTYLLDLVRHENEDKIKYYLVSWGYLLAQRSRGFGNP